MKNKKYFFIFNLLLLLLTSCEYNCPNFDENLLSWMPYKKNNSLIYTNQQHDTISFQINKVDISDGYTTSRKNRNCCESRAIVGEVNNLKGIGCEIILLENSLSIQVSIRIGNNNGLNFLETNDIYSDTQILSINNKQYSEVLVFERDTIKYDDEIWKIILANNYGIVQFYDRETGYIWTLQDD